MGLPTASRAGDILTSQCKPAAGQKGYMNTLIAEHLTGKREEIPKTFWMNRGNEIEPEACTFYEFETGHNVKPSGFCTTDDRIFGGSPDGLTEFGGLEIKCPSPAVHTEYLISGKCPAKYVPQVQSLMWLFEADHWDFVSYHPDFFDRENDRHFQLIVRVNRDDKWQAAWEIEIKKFNDQLQEAKHKLLAA